MKDLKKKVCLTGKVNNIVDREFVKYFMAYVRINDYEVDVFINGQNYDLNTVEKDSLIKLKPGMLADAEIITADQSIFQRIWLNVTKSF